MRNLIRYRQALFRLALPTPKSPTSKFIAPKTPPEIVESLDELEGSSPGGGPSRPPWLKVQLERLKQFLVKLLRAANYRP